MEGSGMNGTTSSTTVPELFGTEDARYFGVLIGIIVILFGTIGNGLTVWAYLRNRNLQSSFNVLIANLCLIDLVFTVIIVPFMLPGYIVGENIYPDSLCAVIAYLYYAALASSLYNLVAIAVNRYIGIVLANKYQKLFTGKRLAACIASIWCVPALLYLPLVVGGAYAWNNNSLKCAVGNNMPAGLRWYNLTLNILFQAIPLLFLIVAYTAIFRKVKQVKAKMKGHQKARLRSTSSMSSAFRQKSGNTSDDTADELKVSSLVEGGMAFRPVRNDSEHKESGSTSHEMSQKANEGTDDEMNSIDKQHPSVSISDEVNEENEKPIRKKKRNSLWNILIQNKSKNYVNANGHAVLIKTNSSPPYGDETANIELIPDQHSEPPLPELIELKQFHRKKSLSTPTLPTFDLENFKLSRTDSKTAYPTHFRQYQEDVRVSEISDNNNEKKMRSRTMSDTTQIITNTMNSQKTRKEKLSTSYASDNESIHKSWHRKSTLRKSEKSNKDRRKNRTLRKRRERERQLAYSSFMICLAFAVCILPTSTLYLIRVLTGLVVPPSTILIVSLIAWLHAIVNPWIYGYLNMQYKKEYLKILKLIKRKLCFADRNSSTTKT